MEDKYGNVHPEINSFKYQVSLIGVYARHLNFNIKGPQKGTIDGLINGGSYKVRIGTGEEMPLDKDGDKLYLVGTGTVKNN